MSPTTAEQARPERRLTLAEVDAETRGWIRNAADELAARNGCRFEHGRGQFVVDWIEDYCTLYEGDSAGQSMTLADWQLDSTLRMFGWVRWSEKWGRLIRRFREANVFIPKKQGKAICLETEVPTPSGFRRFGDLAVGDQLFDETGATCRVTMVTETWTDRPCYRVKFSDGAEVVADAEHLWEVEVLRERYRRRVLRTEDMAESVDVVNGRGEAWAKNYRIRVAGAVLTPEAELPIPPYTMGIWLGDGDSDTPRVTTADPEVLEGMAAEGVRVSETAAQRSKAKRYKIGPDLCGGRQDETYRWKLRKLGVLKDKHIPPVYLFASGPQRLRLLQGLMDSDGAVAKDGQCVITLTNRRLVEDVRTLIASLGYKPTVRETKTRCQTGATGIAWRVQFYGRSDRACCTLPRKRDRLTSPAEKHERSAARHITKIERVPSVPVRCVGVDSASQLFLVTRSFIPTHNSPTLAAWGLYLLCGDGEMGQKVYLAAKDGTQARDIAGKHAMAMVDQSDRLTAACKTNKNEASITHLETRSVMKPLSSSSERTQKSKEGLNGSVLIDELHVVDRAFVDIISRAGISRSEPYLITVSTAGNDPDSYGKYRFDYALQVEAGKVEDQGLFTAIYAAPQDVTDTQIDADPLKYGQMANPAWGRLIDPEEFIEDYRNSRAKGTAEFVTFKMYRLNVWCRAANPWLRMADWEACGREYTLESLRGRRAWLGMDLSRTRDMTAVVAAVEGDAPEEFWLWPLFWLPEETARAVAKLVPFLAWGEKGFLTLTPGRTTDYGFVRTAVRQLAEVLDVQGLFYDETYAEQLTQQLSDGEYASTGEVLVPGLGIERTAFPQKMVALAGPTADFERFILQGTIRHPRHPVLDWQVGHVTVYMDANGNKRPIKPKSADSLKKIDGVVGSIMGVAGAMQGTGVQMSVYNHRRLVTLGTQEPDRRGRAEPPPQDEGGRGGGDARPASASPANGDATPDGEAAARPSLADLLARRWADFVAGGDDD